MNKIKTDILIPFDLHVKDRCKDCRKAIHDRLTRAKALVKKSGQEFVSLNSYSTTCFDMLENMRDMANETQTVEDFSFCAAYAKHVLEEWVAFGTNILDMGADPNSGLSKDDLQQGLTDVMTELKDILDDFTSASKELFQMGASFPTKEIFKDFLKDHLTATNE